jgi:hypothetical protein
LAVYPAFDTKLRLLYFQTVMCKGRSERKLRGRENYQGRERKKLGSDVVMKYWIK